VPSASPAPRVKPRLRGVSHEVAVLLAAPAAVALIAGAESGRARAAAAVYGATLVALFLASAAYHRPTWAPGPHRLVERVDHSAIFLFTAGTYAPLCLLLGPGAGYRLLAVVCSGAALGVLLSVTWMGTPKPLRAGLHLLLGWSFLPVASALHAALGGGGFLLLVGGAMVYTAGALVFALRRPDPSPATFGFHEVFHLFVIAGAACHYVLVRSVIHALG